jgi:hypothetical protein
LFQKKLPYCAHAHTMPARTRVRTAISTCGLECDGRRTGRPAYLSCNRQARRHRAKRNRGHSFLRDDFEKLEKPG